LNRPERNTPEIQRSDLAEVVLLLHSFGIKDATHFDWLDRPDPQAVERAENLLRILGAIRSAQGTGATDENSDMTPIGWQMLRLPMHPRYSRMLVEAAKYGCVPAAALCASLVSGRDLLMRLGRDDKHIAEARELFEASADSDFYTLMRAYQFARNNNFSVEQCRRYGVHAQIARQVQQVYEQIVQSAKAGQRGLPIPNLNLNLNPNPPDVIPSPHEVGRGLRRGARPIHESQSQDAPPGTLKGEDPLLRCITAGFVDQLCKRRDQGTLDCDLTEGRSGTLLRESVVQNSPLFVASSIREVSGRTGNLTLLGLATAVKREWIEEMFPSQITHRIEHLFDRTHKRVSPVKLIRFRDLVIHFEHQREVDPIASGRCLAGACGKQYFELPLFNHEIKQMMARINVVCAVMPELEVPPADKDFVQTFLARAFAGLTLVKEAQATPLRDLFLEQIGRERLEWINELAPPSVVWPDGKKLKLLYPDQPRDDDGQPNSPELQVKLHETFALKVHPHICEGRLPVKLWLCAPDGKRIESTFNWPAFKANSYPKLKNALQQKFPAFVWG
jgi:ATP-dependent helicase HrpB